MKLVIVFALFVCAAYGNVIQKFASLPTGRVVGGEDAKPHSAPYIVSLQYGSSHFCAGSILDPYTIITAAHCINAVPCSSINVVAGLHSLRNPHSAQRRSATKCVTHDKYGGNVGPYDIGLIFLGEPLDLNGNNAVAIDVPEKDFIHEGDVTLFGWGSTSTGIFPNMPDILQTVTKPIVPYKECESVLGGPGQSPLHETNVCTGPLTGGISACSGDSGGPLTQVLNGKVELVGIVSWGYIPCGSKNAPSVYTRTSAYNDWIRAQQVATLIMH